MRTGSIGRPRTAAIAREWWRSYALWSDSELDAVRSDDELDRLLAQRLLGALPKPPTA